MQNRLAASILLLTLAVVTVTNAGAQSAQPQKSADVTGPWMLTGVVQGEPWLSRLNIVVDGEKMTGTASGDLLIIGMIHGSKLEFGFWTQNRRPVGGLFGTFENGKISGEMTLNGQRGSWTAQRPSTRPPDAPRIHNFEPKQFHRLFSGDIEPALKIYPGDTVRTWSVDAGGVDHESNRRSLGGNPQTGPFYIEGAITWRYPCGAIEEGPIES